MQQSQGVTFKSLTESMIDTTTPQGEMLFGFFGLMAQYERALIRERVMAGLDSARKRGRRGGASFRMTPAKLRLAEASMRNPGTTVGDLAKELGVSRQTIYRHLAPDGSLRPLGEKLLAKNGKVTVRANAVVTRARSIHSRGNKEGRGYGRGGRRACGSSQAAPRMSHPLSSQAERTWR
jgi:DNA-binding transcriptional ArsR family regulator